MEKDELLAREAANQAVNEEKLSEEAVSSLEVEIRSLQQQYEQAVVKKRSLQTNCQNIREKLKAMSSLTSVLKGQKEQWIKVVEEHQSHGLVIVNCILAAAFLAYCGPLIGNTLVVVTISCLLVTHSPDSTLNPLPDPASCRREAESTVRQHQGCV